MLTGQRRTASMPR